eukprot:CAMPEP_0185388190 /NCGR_PEP_ID=MMETSP1364-20130426/67761_1 /TAXON_ID=38817 /ORGANISM="Gephyrocapsa oceanica, Strain RCC1303" /LENGTH=214 /DNA_ID=CAMNT_0027990101 /DNA_START=238 /DNA_END=879 /DNA_ORIENTATION=+
MPLLLVAAGRALAAAAVWRARDGGSSTGTAGVAPGCGCVHDHEPPVATAARALWQDERRELASIHAPRVDAGGEGVELQPAARVVPKDDVRWPAPARRPRDGPSRWRRQAGGIEAPHRRQVGMLLLCERDARAQPCVRDDGVMLRQRQSVGPAAQPLHLAARQLLARHSVALARARAFSNRHALISLFQPREQVTLVVADEYLAARCGCSHSVA